MDEPCVSAVQAARHFGVSRSTIFEALKRDEIPHFRLGSLYRFHLSSVPRHLIARWSGDDSLPPRTDLPTGSMVYFVVGVPSYVKIGFTTDLSRRFREMQFACPVRLELVAHLPGGNFQHEKEYHRRFDQHRAMGEWFHLTPEILAEIDRLNSTPSCTGGTA